MRDESCEVSHWGYSSTKKSTIAKFDNFFVPYAEPNLRRSDFSEIYKVYAVFMSSKFSEREKVNP